VTLAAIAAKPLADVLMLVVAERLDFYAKLTRFDSFGRGWTRRCAKDLRYAAQDA
jgi:lysozyme family protein